MSRHFRECSRESEQEVPRLGSSSSVLSNDNCAERDHAGTWVASIASGYATRRYAEGRMSGMRVFGITGRMMRRSRQIGNIPMMLFGTCKAIMTLLSNRSLMAEVFRSERAVSEENPTPR